MKLGKDDIVVNTIVIILGTIVLIVTLYPFWYVIMYALNDAVDSASGGLFLVPRKPTLYHFQVVVSDRLIGISFLVTIARTVVGTITAVFFTAMVSYALSKKHLMFRRTYAIIGLITMYFGGGLVPTYLLYRALGLLNTFWVYIIPFLFTYFHALLFMAFFRELPQSLEDAAKADGATDFYIFRKIILPLSKPILATIALFVGVTHWNDWFASAYYVFNEKLWTVPTVLIKTLSEWEMISKIRSLQAMQGAARGYEDVSMETLLILDSIKYATIVVTVFPITIIYPFLQKYFVKGMLIGHIKA